MTGLPSALGMSLQDPSSQLSTVKKKTKGTNNNLKGGVKPRSPFLPPPTKYERSLMGAGMGGRAIPLSPYHNAEVDMSPSAQIGRQPIGGAADPQAPAIHDLLMRRNNQGQSIDAQGNVQQGGMISDALLRRNNQGQQVDAQGNVQQGPVVQQMGGQPQATVSGGTAANPGVRSPFLPPPTEYERSLSWPPPQTGEALAPAVAGAPPEWTDPDAPAPTPSRSGMTGPSVPPAMRSPLEDMRRDAATQMQQGESAIRGIQQINQNMLNAGPEPQGVQDARIYQQMGAEDASLNNSIFGAGGRPPRSLGAPGLSDSEFGAALAARNERAIGMRGGYSGRMGQNVSGERGRMAGTRALPPLSADTRRLLGQQNMDLSGEMGISNDPAVQAAREAQARKDLEYKAAHRSPEQLARMEAQRAGPGNEKWMAARGKRQDRKDAARAQIFAEKKLDRQLRKSDLDARKTGYGGLGFGKAGRPGEINPMIARNPALALQFMRMQNQNSLAQQQMGQQGLLAQMGFAQNQMQHRERMGEMNRIPFGAVGALRQQILAANPNITAEQMNNAIADELQSWGGGQGGGMPPGVMGGSWGGGAPQAPQGGGSVPGGGNPAVSGLPSWGTDVYGNALPNEDFVEHAPQGMSGQDIYNYMQQIPGNTSVNTPRHPGGPGPMSSLWWAMLGEPDPRSGGMWGKPPIHREGRGPR